MNNFWQSLDTRMANSYRFANNIHIKSDSVKLLFSMGAKDPAFFFFQGMGWRVFKENNFVHKGWADKAYFL